MRYLIAISVALIIVSLSGHSVPESKAPLSDTPGEASLLRDSKEEPKSTFTPLNPEKETLLKLLEATVDQQRDLTKGIEIIDQKKQEGGDEEIIEIYEAKVLTRSLDFEGAQEILSQVKSNETDLLKAAVYIALDDRDQAVSFLHGLVEGYSDAQTKTTALSLLNIYATYDKHRDTDKTYLWTLFAQKLSELGEPEISLYLSNKAIEIKPEYRDAWIIKGHSELILGLPEKAEQSLLSAYKQDPGNTHIQYLLGLTYFELGNNKLSSQYLLYAQQNKSPYQNSILEKLAENALQSDDFSLGAYYYEELLAKNSLNKKALSRLVWIYTQHLMNLEKGHEYALILSKHHHEDPNSFHLLSWVESKMGNVEEATAALEKAHTLE